jgi:hypothetical protein
MLVDGSQAVFKMGGLAEMIGAQGEDLVQARLRALDFYRSNVRAIVIDADAREEFGRQSTSFEQIPNVLDKFMLRLAATVEIPVTILMGQSPAGMNATGESDFRWFYDRIRAQQTTSLSPRVRKLVQIWLATKAGREALASVKLPENGPETISIKFPPLWTETPTAQADRELKVAQRDQIYITTQVFTPEEVALTRGRADGFTTHLQLSEEQLEMRETLASVALSSVSEGEPNEGEGEETASAAAAEAPSAAPTGSPSATRAWVAITTGATARPPDLRRGTTRESTSGAWRCTPLAHSPSATTKAMSQAPACGASGTASARRRPRSGRSR